MTVDNTSEKPSIYSFSDVLSTSDRLDASRHVLVSTSVCGQPFGQDGYPPSQ